TFSITHSYPHQQRCPHAMINSEFKYGSGFTVDSSMREAFTKNGYIIVRNLLSEAEVSKVRLGVETSNDLLKNAYTWDDGTGRSAKLTLWNHPGHDVTGVLARLNRVANTAKELMEAPEVYHFHGKIIMKNPGAGAHLWHQDYGYWYLDGCLYPIMSSVFVAIDDCDRENACLQVLKGSHKMGRQDHLLIGDQRTIVPERVEQAKKVLEHIYVEMKAGDALFFDCNLVHCSGQNDSANRRRWSYIVAFNQPGNDPRPGTFHPPYTPMEVLPDSALLDCELSDNQTGKTFLNLKTDVTTQGKKMVEP
ncbi:unnamed protein product, partial [Meganyctiphanes norvegica]